MGVSEQTTQQKSMWVLISQLHENATDEQLAKIAPAVLNLIERWKSKGNFIWSGPFDNNKTGMAVFDAQSEKDAKDFADDFAKIVTGTLDYWLYNWNIMWGGAPQN
jgi:uncharacterized protein YciI